MVVGKYLRVVEKIKCRAELSLAGQEVDIVNKLPEARFVDVIKGAFILQGMQVDDLSGNRRADLLITSDTGVKAVVEVKYFRSGITPLSALHNAIASLGQAMVEESATVGILATSSVSSILSLAGLEIPENIRIYDGLAIKALVKESKELSSELLDIMRLSMDMDQALLAMQATAQFRPSEDFHKIWSYASKEPLSKDASKAVTIGKALREKFERVESGRGGAKEFEDLCTESLKYIFEDDLTQWKRENRSDTGIHRYDLIARSISDNSFWKSLALDFRSRYVVFEFKNYSRQITQREIYTTEKYLFPTAMRGAAIVVARNGVDENGLSVAKGALREAGKLILIFTEQELFDMLEARDLGDDPSLIPLQKLDEMLMSIER